MANADTTTRKILVSAGSKYGATSEIAARLGEVLASRGHDVTVAAPDDVPGLSTFDAVVLGSAVYMGRWRKDARRLALEIADGLARPSVWLFSSGPVGDPPRPDEDPVDVSDVFELTSAVEHVLFAGKLDKAALGFGDRAIMNALRAPEGDYRDWQEISQWAERIADRLEQG